MAIVIPQDYAAVIHQLRWTSDPEPMALTYGVEIDTASAPTSATACAAALGTLFATHVLPSIPSLVSLVQTEVTWQVGAAPLPPVVGASTTGAGPGGSAAASVLPANSASLVHKRSSLGGPRGRGRMYIPAVVEGDVDNLGQYTPSVLAGWNASLTNWLGNIASNAFFIGMCLLHGPGVSSTPSPTLVTSLAMDPVIATQRRRLRK